MTIDVQMASGHTLSFIPYSYKGQWNQKVPGLYIMAYFSQLTKKWQPLYIGETECFYSRMNPHPKWEAAKKYGATTVLAVRVDDEVDRLQWEDELIKRCQPVLNIKGNPRYEGKGILKGLPRR